jgi:hypothetical protein
MFTFGLRKRVLAVTLLYVGFVLAGVLSVPTRTADDGPVWLTTYNSELR